MTNRSQNLFIALVLAHVLALVALFASAEDTMQTKQAWQTNGLAGNVHDGDTFTLHAEGGNVYHIRLWGVDAPELAQPYGDQSRWFLEHFLAGQQLALTCSGKSHKREVCRVEMSHGIDVGFLMVLSGMAYDSSKYSYGIYAPPEAAARGKRLGVWAQTSAKRPWIFRREKDRVAGE